MTLAARSCPTCHSIGEPRKVGTGIDLPWCTDLWHDERRERDVTDDLRTLAAEAIRELRGRYGPLGDGSLRSGCAGELADAVLTAVLPAHRRQVLAEVLAALRDDAAYLRWAMQQTHVDEHQPTRFTGACCTFADYLTDRFDAKDGTDG